MRWLIWKLLCNINLMITVIDSNSHIIIEFYITHMSPHTHSHSHNNYYY